ncbi:MAG: hypothetical protein E6Q53_00905 [Candidatus Moraniibacteriota bacterium]|nr:MAG: hypothetical protein E6Q53_00905 [Candidatus Moranbacteria bacterium]
MSSIPNALEWYYPVFVMWVAVAAIFSFWLFSRTRSEQFWMSVGGAVCGPGIAYLYRDFFAPPGSPWWHAGFGGCYLGMVVALSLGASKSVLVTMREAPVTSSGKWSLTLVATLIGLISTAFTNVVLATAIGFAAAAYGVVMRRPDLKRLAIDGARSATLLYGALVGVFLLGLPDVHVAGRLLSPYYRSNGPWWTAFTLLIWVPAFGAFFSIGHAFYRDKMLFRCLN